MITSEHNDSVISASNTLLLSSSLDAKESERCFDHLRPTVPAELDILVIAYTRSVTQVINNLKQHIGERPANLAIVDVGGIMRSASGESASSAIQPEMTIYTNSPGNLTGLGITFGAFRTQCDRENQIVVCFDSVTAMLQYVDVKTAFRFLHTITGQIRSIEGFAHFHMNPEAHDPQTVATITSLFDDVIEVD